MNPKVDEFMATTESWRPEFQRLRSIMMAASDLSEDLKWGQPCYTYQGANVVIIHGFKEYCAILFIKGSLMKDPAGVLVAQTKNVQAGRQMRFTSLDEIERLEDVIKDYVQEAIEIEKKGMKVEFKAEFALPEELKSAFDGNEALKTAFFALTPGRQRAYILHFSEPKQAKTRLARIEKNIDRIMDGLGLND